MNRAILLSAVAAFFLTLGGVSSVQAQYNNAPWSTGQSNPSDLKIELVTVDPGSEIYSWWGHTALIVDDTRLHYSLLYNYGLFSFGNGFVRNFAMGRLIFQVGDSPTAETLDLYRQDNRTIHLQTLDLPPDRKMAIARFLAVNVLPQNREYLYDHYYNNCSTRVRDIINQAVDGRLKELTSGPSSMTLRQLTRRFTQHHFLMDTLLMFLMSGSIDRPITEWNDMFLPDELEKYVGRLQVPGPHGMMPLVSKTTVWYQSKGRPPIPARPSPAWPLSAALGLAMGILALLGSPSARGRWRVAFANIRAWERWRRRIYGIYSALLGLLLGIPGALLFFMSLFTNHTVTYSNENVALVCPLLILLLPLGIAIAAGSKKAATLTGWLWRLQLLAALVLLVLKVLPSFDQQNWQIFALVLPLYVGAVLGPLAVGAWRRSRQIEAPQLS